MPKKIIFILSEHYLEYAKSHINTLEQNVIPHGSSILLTDAGYCSDLLPGHTLSETAFCQTLFITDMPTVLDTLLGHGLYAIALYHEGNQSLSFPGALYAVEDILKLEYRSYQETYRRLAGIPWDILETRRLLVRESKLDDIPDFYRIYQNPSITDYMEPLFENPEEEKAYLQDYIKQVYGFYGFGIWTVLLKETGKIIGRAGLNIREGYDVPELGFVIEAALQNQGLAFEVCSAILTYAKEELELSHLQAFVKKGNTASQSLLKKLGFTYSREATENGQKYKLYTLQLL